MSKENVEIVRRAYEAWESSDFETLFALADERAVIHRVPPLGGGTYHGHEGLIETSIEWSEDFAEWEMRAEELFDLGDQVLVRMYQRAVGAPRPLPASRIPRHCRAPRLFQALIWIVGRSDLNPTTFRPPAERQSCPMCPGASRSSNASTVLDDLDVMDVSVGTKAVPRARR
jgi:SnoaL-like protein